MTLLNILSALKENEAYLDSIQGRIDLFNNSVQTMWMNFIDSEVIKFIVNIGTGLIKLVDNIGLIETALMGVVAYLTIIKKQDLSKSLFGGFLSGKKNKISLLKGSDLDDEIERFNSALAGGTEVFGEYKTKAKEAGNGMDILATKLEQGVIKTKNGKVAAEDYTVALQSQSKAATKAANAEKMKNMAIGLSVMAISGIISAIQSYADSIKTLNERYEELQSSISTAESDVNSLESKIESIEDQVDALSNKDLTITEAEELRKLREQSAELQKQKKLRENILSLYNKQNEITSLEMFNKRLSETAAGQEKAKETASAWAKALGTIADVALVIGGIAVTGATFGGATALGAAMMGAGMSGSATSLAGIAADKWGGSSKSKGEDLSAWYDSYTDAISEADKAAAEAESKYLSDVSDANYEAWQKKLDAVNTLKEDLYNNLEEMQGYISNLEYNDTTAATINEFNDLMTHISVKSNDGNIEAQISSIQSMTDEFYKLSRGVDENGKNVALSAEEYERYRDIVDQILSYAPGLIQGYDEEGNAILGAADAQLTYNQLLVQSIELLREQRRLAAQDIISAENIQKTYDDVQKGFQSDIKNIDSSGLATFVPGSGNAGGFAYTTNHIEDVIEGVVGKSEGWWADNITTDPTDFIKNNLNIISQKLPEIQKAIAENMLDSGFTQEETDEYVNTYMEWLSGLIAQCGDATEKANSKIREMLYSAPQSSEYYYDMSGEQLTFINSYIASLEGLKDKTEDEIKGIADGIVGLMSLINSSGNLQDSINDLITLDPSSMPIDAYRKKFEELWDEVGATIPVEHQEAFRNYLFPDEDQIDTMIASVREKLIIGSKGLADNLSLEELRVAYKIIPELKDDISFDELRKEIQEQLPKVTGPIVQTYSTLTEQVAKFNEVVVQTSEIVLDNTKVTQEYKDSLVELGVSEEELAECFDTTNGLVVTNAKGLNKLVKSAKKNTAQNAKLAKSQARLQYYELYKKMRRLVGVNGEITEGNIDVVRSLYEEMNALEKTISKYSMLEAQLLGNVNAFEKFQEAQEIDSATDYIGSAEDMVLALGEAFNTAELGSETAQAAIMGLVPESVYADLETLDEKMAAIYDYFKNGKIAQYFDLSFDEDGNIESAEMKLGNLRKFIEDGLLGDNNGDDINPFVGSDWQHFELNQTWLDSLPEGTDVLQALADQMNVTKEVAFAFVKSFKDHDIEWLDGDYSTFFDQMLASTNEGKIQLYTERLADLTMQQAELAEKKAEVTKQYNAGSISEDEYNKKIEEINKKQEELNKNLDDYNTKLAEAKNASKQNIFGVGEKGSQYEGKADYQIKTSSEIEATDNLDELDNWIERNEKVEQLYEEQEEAQKEYTKALEDHAAAVEANGGKELDANHETVVALKEAEKKYKSVTNAVSEAIKKRDEFTEPTVLEIEVAIDEVEKQIESTKKTLDEKLVSGTHTITVEIDGQTIQQDVTSTEQLLDSCFHIDEDGYWVINAGVNKSELEQKYPEILNYVNLLNSNTTLNAFLNDTEAQITLDDLSTQIQEIIDLLEGMKINLDPDSVTEFSRQLGELCKPRNIVTYIGSFVEGLTSDGESGPQKVNGTAHAHGTAHKSGDWGLPQSEHDSLVGELGPELVVDPQSGRYYTVGDNGAEFVDLKRGSIIFNHKQTESLLKNGYVTSRGKAYAEGNAHVTIWPDASSKTQWEGTGYSGPDDPTWDINEALANAADLSDAMSDAADSVGEFEEAIDWIEIRMEEFDEHIGKLSAELENLTTAAEKNAKIDEIIAENQKKKNDALAGAAYYEQYAQKYLEGMNATLVEAAKNGAIAITEFTKEQDEATVNAIQNYRDYAQKAADLYQQAEEIITEIADLAKQAFDNVVNDFENQLSLNDSKISQHESHNDLLETDKGFASEGIYQAIIEENNAKLKILEQQRDAMQAELNTGKIEEGTDDWYDAVNAIAEVDTEIINLNTEIEDLQDSINELHWEKFDLLMTQFQAVSDEAENLLDILGTKDAVDELGNWTDEGISSLGLLAQQMEVAEKQADKYKQEIEYLNKNWKKLGYTQEEYVEKLEELKSGQYDAIQSYHDAKDAIVDLNEERVDAIKDGIEKEIEAYEELIEKKKEALDSEKDLYDFQKNVAEQQKNIADIQRKLAALEGDNSSSARAQKAKLQAELYEAQSDLEDTYYDRSVSNQQNALDQELENFQEQKEEEIEGWEKYLENLELVVADSLAVVQENTSAVLATLQAMQTQYGLTITDTLIRPWKAGELAIQEYGAKLNVSLTTLAAMFGLTVDQFAAKLGLTTEQLVSNLDITVAQMAENLGLTNEQLAAKLGITVTNLNGMMSLTIQELAANLGITLPVLAEKLGTTTAGLAGNLDMTMTQFAGSMGLTVEDLASKFGLSAQSLADKLGMTYQELMNPFGLSMSATVDELKRLETEYSNILAGITGDSEIAIDKVNKAMDKYQNKNKEVIQTKPQTNNITHTPKPQPTSVGSKINAGNARIYADSYGGGGGKQYYASDPNYVVLSENNGYILVRHHKLKSGYTGWFKKSDLPKYASGTLSTKKDQLAILDELGDELQLVPGANGRLEYIKKGTGIVPADITPNLMEWGELNPQDMLDRNRPTITAPHIVNNEINITLDVGEVVHIDTVTNDTIPDLTKAVRKEMDSYMTKVNNAIRSKVR